MNYLHTTLVISGGVESGIVATFKIVTKTATKYTSIADITNDVNNFIGYECVSPLVGEDILVFDDWYGGAVKSAIYNGEASITSEKISLGNVLVTENDGTQNMVIPVADVFYTDEVTTVIPRISVDLATAFPDKWAGLTIGEHTIQIRAKNPGNYLDSDLSTAKTFYKTVPITVTATNCTAAASNPTEFPDVGGGDTILTFNKKTGYTLPETIVITGVAGQNIGYSWTVASDGQSAQLKILKALGNIEVTVTGVAETYNITVNGTHASKASGPSTITYGGSATLTFAYDNGYFAPASIKEVTGATGSWNQSTSTLTLTNCEGPVTVTIEGATKTFNITYSLTNVNSASGNPTTIASNASAVKITLVKPTGYNLPNEVAITGVDAKNWSYDGTTGIITISRPTANVTISAVGQAIVYTITTTTENATADPSNPSTIAYGTTATLQFTFPADYTAPDDADVAVTGATKQWTKSTGTLVLSNPTANVTVRVAGVWELKELTGTYTWKETIPEATWTEQLVNFALADGTAYKKMYWTDNGTTYNLYYDDMLEGGSETKVYSYDADAQTGTWVDPKYRIVNFTSEDVQYVPANFYNYVIANTTQATQLSTPQNVSADGTVVSWDEVENATSYAVLADGSEIGTGVQLATPQNVTANRTAVSWNAVENATWYEILVGSSDFGAVYTTSVHLSELPGWESLADGEYSVTIVAKADRYIDSEPSAAVSVEKVTEVFVQIFPTATSDNYTLIENLNQSKIYSIKFTNSSHVDRYIIYENDGWHSGFYRDGSWEDRTPYDLVSQTNNSIVLTFAPGSGFDRYLSGITLEGDTEATVTDFDAFSPTTVYACWVCFVEGTKITLSDGSTKPAQDIQYDDELLVWDFDNACLTSAKPLWIMKAHKATKYNHLVFSDGSTLDTVNQHRIFNLEKGMFTYPMTDDTPTGTTTFNDKGEYITLVSKEVIEGEVNYYNIITDYHMNLFAGTILTSCRLSNLYPIKDMRYVRDGRNIVPYEEFNNIPIEYYYGLRLGEQPTDINRDGAVSFGDTSVEDYVQRLINIRKK